MAAFFFPPMLTLAWLTRCITALIAVHFVAKIRIIFIFTKKTAANLSSVILLCSLMSSYTRNYMIYLL